jgi:hypothetical protein
MSKTIIIHPTSESKFEAISSFLKAFDVKFEIKKKEDTLILDENFIAELDRRAKATNESCVSEEEVFYKLNEL